MQTKTYITSQGETWDIISFKIWNKETFCSDLMEANPDHRETVFFGSGVKLIIPEVSQNKQPENLPPWKS